jgi:hypothetical protein
MHTEHTADVPQPEGCMGPALFVMIAIFASILYAKGCP